ncbi:hypothetical protein [Streptantibioticus ferralitis]|uniref:Uncharacterized protein n=1 Tax=Streptantibioticus ferralitis TaxID=236510 RepID=A0ABT5YS06_9ACTN|nr:hypothetical protein [Streptantibioticus ferralitis]MDF2254367.1 hypothetical protein [Streptantibioticus ferralitis]
MLETTDRATQPVTTQPTACSGPLLQLEFQPEAPTGPVAIRCLRHWQELALRGIPAFCSACSARRDWLLINEGRTVWIQCRCGNQWAEPEITRADFEALINTPDQVLYPSLNDAIAAQGFDGTLAGSYLL